MGQTEKNTLRKELRARTRSLSPEYILEAGAAITERLLTTEAVAQADIVFTFISTASEPDTHRLIEELWKRGKRVCVPKCLPDRQMAVVELTDWAQLAPAAMGLLEPVSTVPQVEAGEVDLVIVPCVAAWYSGARLGHGGGYYDRFLERCVAEKLCVCFEQLLCADIPMTAQDIPMDYLLTERGLTICSAWSDRDAEKLRQKES